MTMTLESAAFRDRAPLPARFTGTGTNVSPPLRWRGAPEGTRSFALVVDDPDAPRGTFTHWTLWNLPPTLTQLGEAWTRGAVGVPGRNGFGRAEYAGPMPPPGDAAHRYFFRLYALDIDTLELPDGASRAELDRAMQGHVLASAALVGCFERAREAAAGPR